MSGKWHVTRFPAKGEKNRDPGPKPQLAAARAGSTGFSERIHGAGQFLGSEQR